MNRTVVRQKHDVARHDGVIAYVDQARLREDVEAEETAILPDLRSQVLRAFDAVLHYVRAIQFSELETPPEFDEPRG